MDKLQSKLTNGRKNFVLISSTNDTKSSAMFYSLAETARSNLINTNPCFELLLTEIPKHTKDNNISFIDKLLMPKRHIQADLKNHKIYKVLNIYRNFAKPAEIQVLFSSDAHD